MFNLAGALVYLVVALAAWRAALHCARAADRREAAGSVLHWRAIALLFAGLAAWRIGNGEAIVQALVRDAAQAGGSYEFRRSWQAPVVALAVAAGGAWTIWLTITRHADALKQWSRFAALGLLGYSALRLVSFHPVDALIYWGVGPFHLNHVIDLGLAGIVGYCAILACKVTGGHPVQQRKR